MSGIDSTATDRAIPADLISFLKAIPDGRYRRGVRYPQWFLLLVAVLGILSGCRSSRDLEAFAKQHREALNFKRWPSDATFLYLFNKAHLQEFGEVLQAWMISQISGGVGVWTNWSATARPCVALPSRPRMAITGSLLRSPSTPALWALPWHRRPTTPMNPARRPPSRNC
jgi:hypothetical protein